MAPRSRRPLIAGNWKMNGLGSSRAELEQVIAGAPALVGAMDLMICPPATLIAAFAALARGSAVAIGGQDCHAEPAGAFTGDISAEMLRDAGASAVIVGHSERRMYHRETDADVCAKALAARRAGLLAIVCVGETKDERAGGATLGVVARQLAASLPAGAGRRPRTLSSPTSRSGRLEAGSRRPRLMSLRSTTQFARRSSRVLEPMVRRSASSMAVR